MKLLSKLKPAETILIMEGSKSEMSELLKLTFLDLLIKQVLETSILSQRRNESYKAGLYKYVTKGRNFQHYNPFSHELVFLSPYRKSGSIKVLIQHLIRMGFQNAGSRSEYFSLLRNLPNMRLYFKQNLFQSLFGSFSLSQEGRILRDQLKEEIVKLEKDLPLLIVRNKEKALQILNSIGGNILLLKNIDIVLLNQLEPEIIAETIREFRNADHYGFSESGCTNFSSGCSGCSGCGGGCSAD